MKITQLDIKFIQPDPLQPRKVIVESEVERLSQSLIRYKQLTPIIVYRKDDLYVLVDGHRRLLAAVRANIPTLDAIVLEQSPSPNDLLAMQLVIE
ncbi:MAG: ParB N-terminal domain-containing protein, partial [Pirellulales bacterium]